MQTAISYFKNLKMKKITLLAALFVLFIFTAQAKIFRIGYPGNKLSGVDYDQFDGTVMAAASAGDTIQIYQNYVTITSSAIDKKLIIIGFGHTLENNPNLQVVTTPNAGTFSFEPGSEGSVIEGIYGNMYIGASNITVTRCKGSVQLGYSAQTGATTAISNITITDNWGSIQDYQGTNGNHTNITIANNICTSVNLSYSSGLFMNNISTSPATLNAYVVKNNIFTYGGCPSGTGSTFNNNLFAGDCSSFGGNNNKQSVDMNTVFTNWNNNSITTETQLTLKAGSPAIGAGINNSNAATDAGIYGGELGWVYKLSGVPPVPSIYKLTAPSQNANSNPYTITISVRSNN